MKSEQHECVSEEKYLSIIRWGDDTVLVAIGQGDGDEAEEIEVKCADLLSALVLVKGAQSLVRVSVINYASDTGGARADRKEIDREP